jgi:hypothetical protein
VNLIAKLIIAIFCCQIFIAHESFAAQSAVVGSDKAVIYSDREMSSPIGFVTKGKKLRVGEVKRNKGRVLPVVVNGRIAYIKVNDIYTSENAKLVDDATKRFQKSTKENKPFNLELNYSYFRSNYTVDTNLTDVMDSQVFSFGGITLKGHLRKEESLDRTRVGMQVMEGFNDIERIKYFSLDIDKSYHLFTLASIDVSFFAGLNLIPWCEYKFNNLFTKNGYGLGAYTGSEFLIGLSQNISMHFDVRFQALQLRGVQVPDILNTSWDPSFMGASASLGLSYLF